MNIIVSQLSLVLAVLRVIYNSCSYDIIFNLVFGFLYSFFGFRRQNWVLALFIDPFGL